MEEVCIPDESSFVHRDGGRKREREFTYRTEVHSGIPGMLVSEGRTHREIMREEVMV